MSSSRLKTKLLKWSIVVPSVLLLLSPFLASCIKSSLPVDSRRDQMLDSSSKVLKVFSKELNLSKDRIMLNLRLDQIGVGQENKLKIQSALKKELDMEIPYKVLNEKNTVGTVIRFVAVQKNSEIKLKPHSNVKLLAPPDKAESKPKSKGEADKKTNEKNESTSQKTSPKDKDKKTKSKKLKSKSNSKTTKSDDLPDKKKVQTK